MEMIDVGKEMSKIETVPMPTEGKNKKSYPTLYIPSEALKGKEVGATCRLEIIAKVIGIHKDENSSEATLEVHKVGYKADAGKLSKEEYLGKSEDERAEYDKENMKKDVEVEEDDADE